MSSSPPRSCPHVVSLPDIDGQVRSGGRASRTSPLSGHQIEAFGNDSRFRGTLRKRWVAKATHDGGSCFVLRMGLTNRFVLSWVQEQTGFYESGVVVEWLIDLESQLFHVMRYTVETGFQFDL